MTSTRDESGEPDGSCSRKRNSNLSSSMEDGIKKQRMINDDYFQKNYHKTGLVYTLHGNIYQLKLQMLFLKRALDNGYEFNLGTEVDDAEKFDDIVFKYKNKAEASAEEIRFVQVKHKQDESTKITENDLLKDVISKENDFSLQKYLISYSKIKKKLSFTGNVPQKFIIITNIDFGDLKLIRLEPISETDNILQVTKCGVSTKRYKLIVPKDHELYKKLRDTSDLHVLATVLLKRLLANKPLQLTTDVLKTYHILLAEKVLLISHTKNKNRSGKTVTKSFARFREEFILGHNLSEDVSNFRDVISSKLKDTGLSWKNLCQKEFQTSEKFGEVVESQIYCREFSDLKINDAEIDAFFEDLVFAVNQPNEVELGKIITEELGQSSQFNLLNANLVSNSFQTKMLDWFKEKHPQDGQEGVWLDSKSGQSFMDSIENEVSGLVSVGISVAYPEKLARYGVLFDVNPVFEHLEYFISKQNQSKKVLHIMSRRETLLSAINVNSALENLKKKEEFAEYQHVDSIIFLRLSTLLGNKIQQYVIDSFESTSNHKLLIIDCKFVTQSLETVKLCMKLSEILQQTKKKLIIIAESQTLLMEFFPRELKLEMRDETSFSNFTGTSKENVLQREVVFQGNTVAFSTLVNQSYDNVNEIIDAELTFKLLKGEEITINNALPKIKEYYISRRCKRVVLSKDKLKKQLNSDCTLRDIFVINGLDMGLGKHDNIYPFDNFKSAEQKFIELCNQNLISTDCSIHWLQNDQHLVWYKTHGSVENIASLRLEEVYSNADKNSTHFDETKLILGSDYEFVIISDTAGMGKSTLLTHLSIGLQREMRCVWISRINLNDHTTHLKHYKDKLWNKGVELGECETKTLFHSLLKELVLKQLQTDLEKKLFYNQLNKTKNIVLLLDGFDEICPTYKDIVIDFLRSLKQFFAKRLYITTRPNVKNELEQVLDTFSFVLEPFSEPEQAEFLSVFWTEKLQLNKLDTIKMNRLGIYVDAIIKFISKSTNSKEQEFIGIPLQTKLVAEVFQENQGGVSVNWQNCKEFLESENDSPSLPNNYALLDLYEHFVERKFYKLYLEDKKTRDLTKVGESEAATEEFKRFKERCCLMSLSTIFESDILAKLLSPSQTLEIKKLTEEVKANKYNEGIIDDIKDTNPQFVHRTFAEYFASYMIAAKMLTCPAETLQNINSVMLNLSPIFMSSIIEQLNGKYEIIESSLQKPFMEFISGEICSNFLKCLLIYDFKEWPRKLDAYGKTPLHYAIESDRISIAKKILDYANDIPENVILKHGHFINPEYKKSRLVTFINIQDNHGLTALKYALQKNHIDFAFDLLLKGASIDLLENCEIITLRNKMLEIKGDCKIYDNSILAAYANQDNKYRPIEEKLLLKSPSVFKSLWIKDQSRILSYFFVHGRVEVIDTLLNTIENSEERTKLLNNPDNGFTPLDRVNQSDQLSDEDRIKVTKYILEHGGKDLSSGEHNVTKVLQVAAGNGSLETFKTFLPQEEYSLYYKHIYVACQANQIEIVKHLFECHTHKGIIMDSYGNTPLHAACDSDTKLKIIKLIIEYNNDVNIQNERGETPIFMAVYARARLTLFEYLIAKGADINCEDDFNETPLTRAIRNNNDEVVELFLSHGARISDDAPQILKDKFTFFESRNTFDFHLDGYPRLHCAIRNSVFEWALFLIRHGADVNEVDSEKQTALHWACQAKQSNDSTSLVELLLQYGAKFDLKNDNNLTPRDLIRNTDSKIYWLLEVLDKLFTSQHFSQDFYELLLNNESSRYAHWGPYGSGHPDAWDGDNPMLFLLNARNHQGKTLLHLAAADVNATENINLFKLNRDYLGRQKELLVAPRYQDFKSIPINEKDINGSVALHIASQNGNYFLVKSLLKQGAIFNTKNLYGETSEELAAKNEHDLVTTMLRTTKNIFTAAETNNVSDMSKFLDIYLKSYRDERLVNARNKDGRTPLHLVASLGHLMVAQLLLEMDADINAVDLNNDTPLHIAVQNNHVQLVMWLLSRGAIYNLKNNQCLKPVDLVPGPDSELSTILKKIDESFACILGEFPHNVVNILQTITEICSIRTVVDVRDNKLNTLLHLAVKSSEYSIVEFLLENGASFNPTNLYRQAPKDFSSDLKINSLLTSIASMVENIRDNYKSSNVNTKIIRQLCDFERTNLLFYAVDSGSLDIVKYLVERGVSIDLTKITYKFPLHAKYDEDLARLEIIKFLIDNGDVNATNYKGETALIIAIKANTRLEVIQYLISKGCDVHHADAFGNTPMTIAVTNGNADLIQYLNA